MRLWMIDEIATAMQVGRQRAYTISREKGFPNPVATVRAGRIWLADDVEAWIAANRPGGQKSPEQP